MISSIHIFEILSYAIHMHCWFFNNVIPRHISFCIYNFFFSLHFGKQHFLFDKCIPSVRTFLLSFQFMVFYFCIRLFLIFTFPFFLPSVSACRVIGAQNNDVKIFLEKRLHCFGHRNSDFFDIRVFVWFNCWRNGTAMGIRWLAYGGDERAVSKHISVAPNYIFSTPPTISVEFYSFKILVFLYIF